MPVQPHAAMQLNANGCIAGWRTVEELLEEEGVRWVPRELFQDYYCFSCYCGKAQRLVPLACIGNLFIKNSVEQNEL